MKVVAAVLAWIVLVIASLYLLPTSHAAEEPRTYTEAEAEVIRAELAELYSALERSTHVTPEAYPDLQFLNHEALERTTGIHNALLKGFYRDGIIYLDNQIDLRTPMGISIILHELVHHFQFAKAGPAKDCDEWQQREQFAYAEQQRFLSAQGIMFSVPQQPLCL